MARKVHYGSGHIIPLGCRELAKEQKAHLDSKYKGEKINDAWYVTKYSKPVPITRSCITKVTCRECLAMLIDRCFAQEDHNGIL